MHKADISGTHLTIGFWYNQSPFNVTSAKTTDVELILNIMSINPSAFSTLNERLLNAGKVRHSDLGSIGKSSLGKGKPI
jgi:hypothetical protein